MATRTSLLLRREKMDTTISTLIDLFIASKQVEGKSPGTLKWYKNRLTHFAEFISDGEEATIRDISVHDARAFIAHLQGKTIRYRDHTLHPPKEGGLSPHTIHGYVRVLKAFSSWLYDEGFTSHNIFAKLQRPKLPEPMIEILSDDEIRQILDAINPNTFLGARLQAIVLLLLDTGMRASELCNVKLDDVHLQEGYVKVLGKGNKERIVPFGATTKKSLIRYIHTFRPEPIHEGIDNLILSIDGTPLTYTGLALAIKRLGRKAGVPRIHPHLFRHTFAVKYLINGGDIMTLRLILGHTTLEVTKIYMHLAQSHVQLQHHKFSPVDRLGLDRKRRRR